MVLMLVQLLVIMMVPLLVVETVYLKVLGIKCNLYSLCRLKRICLCIPSVGERVGAEVGGCDGEEVGVKLGASDGAGDGDFVGARVGAMY